ncbi:hypothetical protein HPB47_016126 [Ixodes persulcatus]|uniref:Uncharacterized protein n=1 Tax=Ixodes persulcatus TaxID=34615 RepID=A0AC60QRP5_IXOPE|nr:hypothetical protein HPB47_016126 [Ixodes persulcatus]
MGAVFLSRASDRQENDFADVFSQRDLLTAVLPQVPCQCSDASDHCHSKRRRLRLRDGRTTFRSGLLSHAQTKARKATFLLSPSLLLALEGLGTEN